MGNLLVLYDNQTEQGFLSELPSALPLSNLQNSDLASVWRSAGVAPENTRFDLTLPRLVVLRGVVLVRTNATTAVRYRFRAFSDAERDEEIYTSLWQQYGVRAIFGTLPWGDPDLWTGYVPHEDPDRPPDIPLILPGLGVSSRFWTIEIEDTGNPNGYFEAAMLLTCKGFSPSINYAYGSNGFSFEDNSVRRRKLNGGDAILRRVNPRVVNFGIDSLPDNEAFGGWYDVIRRSGFDRDIYVVPDSEMTGLDLQRRGFLANISQLDAITQAMFGRSSVGFSAKERI